MSNAAVSISAAPPCTSRMSVSVSWRICSVPSGRRLVGSAAGAARVMPRTGSCRRLDLTRTNPAAAPWYHTPSSLGVAPENERTPVPPAAPAPGSPELIVTAVNAAGLVTRPVMTSTISPTWFPHLSTVDYRLWMDRRLGGRLVLGVAPGVVQHPGQVGLQVAARHAGQLPLHGLQMGSEVGHVSLHLGHLVVDPLRDAVGPLLIGGQPFLTGHLADVPLPLLHVRHRVLLVCRGLTRRLLAGGFLHAARTRHSLGDGPCRPGLPSLRDLLGCTSNRHCCSPLFHRRVTL